MKHCQRFRHGWFPLALAAALQQGCQFGNLSLPVLPRSGGADSPNLSASQVADIQVGMGRSLEKRGEVGQAVTAYAQAYEKDPKRVDACIRLGVLADARGKFPDALKWYRKALDLQPENPDIYCDLGYSLYLQGQWAAAEANLRKALALAPDHQRAHNNLGLVLGRAGRCDDALAEFRRGGCSQAGAHSNLAFVLTLRGSWADAREHYLLALKEEPSLALARKGLHELDALIAKANAPGPQLACGGDPVLLTPRFDDGPADTGCAGVSQVFSTGTPAARN